MHSKVLSSSGHARVCACVRGLACAYLCMAALLATASAPAGAVTERTATTLRNDRAGIGRVKAAPVVHVPASARVQGGSSTSTTSTIPSAATTTPATPSTAGGTTAQGVIPTPGKSSAPRAAIAPAHRHSSSKLSRTALVGAVLAGLLILLCVVWALVRWLAIEPRWTRSLSYSLEEAGFRVSATWAELLDWARIGR